jgi:hypothetical protein
VHETRHLRVAGAGSQIARAGVEPAPARRNAR